MPPRSRVGTTDSRSFERDVILSDIPVLVDFWAPWCAPCEVLRPRLDEAACSLTPSIRVLSLNVDEAPAIADICGVRTIPALRLFVDSDIVAAWEGLTTADEIVRRVRACRIAR